MIEFPLIGVSLRTGYRRLAEKIEARNKLFWGSVCKISNLIDA